MVAKSATLALFDHFWWKPLLNAGVKVVTFWQKRGVKNTSFLAVSAKSSYGE